MALTTRRPVIGPYTAVPFAYLGGTLYYETARGATHPVLVRSMVEAGVPKTAIPNGIFGYISNLSHDEVPQYEYDTTSDFFPSTPDANTMAELDAKLQALFPDIKL